MEPNYYLFYLNIERGLIQIDSVLNDDAYKAEKLATEERISRSRRISHGRTRKNTEGRTRITMNKRGQV